MKILIFVAVFLFAALVAPLASADTITIDFENLSDSTIIGSSYLSNGVIFSGAAIATAGFSLNDSEFPPRSGVNVAFDATGPITLFFVTPVSLFSGFFTYAQTLSLTGLNASNQSIATATSLFGSNFVSSGNAPNELLQLSFASGISQIVIAGDPAGSSFALDDVTFTTIPPASPVPEPGTLSLLVAGLIFLILRSLLTSSS
jgi:hypothetical protein